MRSNRKKQPKSRKRQYSRKKLISKSRKRRGSRKKSRKRELTVYPIDGGGMYSGSGGAPTETRRVDVGGPRWSPQRWWQDKRRRTVKKIPTRDISRGDNVSSEPHNQKDRDERSKAFTDFNKQIANAAPPEPSSTRYQQCNKSCQRKCKKKCQREEQVENWESWVSGKEEAAARSPDEIDWDALVTVLEEKVLLEG